MGSRVRIRLFHILHFVRDLLFPLLKNSKSGVHDRGHRLRFIHALEEGSRGHITCACAQDWLACLWGPGDNVHLTLCVEKWICESYVNINC